MEEVPAPDALGWDGELEAVGSRLPLRRPFQVGQLDERGGEGDAGVGGRRHGQVELHRDILRQLGDELGSEESGLGEFQPPSGLAGERRRFRRLRWYSTWQGNRRSHPA